ncbi:unnamed protein product [Phytophthora lilii]|uniref:Unnamed protein product n=1 Tax=Phytophthora lilii TaxID=2077276 RepID=A0A9W6UCN4_9STRA|nr:unnamed protein product [Phytophthora lilii]
MRLIGTLLATAVILLASSENLVAAKTTQAPGLYAELYSVKDGVVTDKMRVPLGDADQYKNSEVKQLKNVGVNDQEERAAASLPALFTKGPLHGLFKGFGSFLSKIKSKTKWANSRRLRIEGA